MESKVEIRKETAEALINLLMELPLKVSAGAFNLLQRDIAEMNSEKQKSEK